MTAEIAGNPPLELDARKIFYNRFLLIVAGLGGLLYGVDVGIIAGALPYLEATSGLTGNQLSTVVAAVLLGSVISTLFAGLLADWMGRKSLMTLSGIMFVISIPMIALANGYGTLVIGRLLQGVSAGLIGVVVPLYLAECLVASNRGKGTGVFQWLLTLGIAAAALIGLLFSFRLDHIAKLGDAQAIFNFKNSAWRGIFWVSLPPGLLFVVGSLMLAESPRWLLRRGKKDAAYAALLRSRTTAQADLELREMEDTAAAEKTKAAGEKTKESLLRRKYVIPFVLACIILACNQATGINSIIAYNTNILLQSGLSDLAAHIGYVLFTFVNFFVTFGAVVLVDRKGRKFLLTLGTAGIIVSLICTGFIFRNTESLRVDARGTLQSIVSAIKNSRFAMTKAPRRHCSQQAPPANRARTNPVRTSPHRWSSSIPTEISALRRKPYAPMTVPPHRLRSPAKAACPPTRSSPSSRIRSATSSPPAWLPCESRMLRLRQCRVRATAGWWPSRCSFSWPSSLSALGSWCGSRSRN